MSTSTEADDTLYIALLQVCDRSFFTLVESCDGTRFAALVKNAASDAAFEDMSKAKFIPAFRNGKPVACDVKIQIYYPGGL